MFVYNLTIDAGKSIKEASEIFNNAGHSGSSAAMVLKIVVNFSARGTEFFRANYLHEITPETEGFLQQLDADNARYAREAQERAKMVARNLFSENCSLYINY